MRNTKADSAYKWRAILSHFVDAHLLDGQHRPCPLCSDAKTGDRFRFEPDTERGMYICNQCGAGSGIHLLAQLKGIGYTDAWQLVASVLDTCQQTVPKKQYDRTAFINRILRVSSPIVRGDEVHSYLLSRGIHDIPSGLFKAHTKNGISLMVGRFALGNKMTGLHVTFIKNGQQAHGTDGKSKKMYGIKEHALAGSAIRLHPLGNGKRLILGEGIETTARAAQIFTGYDAVWATGSAGLMELLQLPSQVEEVLIAGDNDASYTGQKAAYTLANRLTVQKKPVKVCVQIYHEIDKDWADDVR